MKYLLVFSCVLVLCLTSCFYFNKKTKTTNEVIKTESKFVQQKINLSECYKDYFPIGTALYYGLLTRKDRIAFISSQYNSITIENELKAKYIHPEINRYYWAKADSLVHFATENQMKIRGHCLVWAQGTPEWFFKNEKGDLISKEELYKRMREHIFTVMKRYKGKIYCWDVVNEAVDYSWKPGIFKDTDLFFKIAGEEYIDKAFQYAREADSSAILFYNDNQFNDPRKSNDIYNLIKRLKSRNVPIDGIGMQGHFNINGLSENDLRNNIIKFSGLGLDIQITELDVRIFKNGMKNRNLSKQVNYFTTLTEKQQADIYDMIFRVCREYDNVTGITLWGAADWPNYLDDVYGVNAHPYLFSKDLKPKEAFFRVVDF
ncbi:MAG: endo-1,4-beta-xylanase [Bacteroidota bacterium]|nr:endo-1,4-beta-xylanase [Bacteroidota bacterium]